MKRFLSIFAIMALVVSMFSGVAFAAIDNSAYDLELDVSTLVHGVNTTITVTVNPTSTVGGETANDLDTYSVSVYDSSDNVTAVTETVIDGGTHNAALTDTEIGALDVGTYTVKISAVPAGSITDDTAGVQTLEDASSNEFTVTAATFTVTPNDTDLAQAKLDTAKAEIPDTYISTADGEDLVAWAAALITDGDVSVNATVTSSDETHVDTSGIVSRDDTEADVTVTFTLGTTTPTTLNDTKAVTVTVRGDDLYNIELDVDKVAYNENNTVAKIPGKIINADSKALAKVDGRISVYPASATDFSNPDAALYSIEYSGGEFELMVYPSVLQIGEFQVVGYEGSYGAGYNFENAQYNEVGKFTVQYEMELAEPSELKFDYPLSGQIVVQGSFVNEDAKLVYGANAYIDSLPKGDFVLGYVDADNKVILDVSDEPIAEASFCNDKTFGFLFDGARITNKGDIGLFIQIAADDTAPASYLLVMTGEVTVGTFDTTVTKELPKEIGSQDLDFTLNLPSKYIKDDGKTLEDNYSIVYTIEDSSETAHADHDTQDLIGLGGAFDETGQVIALTLDIDGDSGDEFPLGDYTVKLELQKSGVVQLTSEATFEVGKADNYNLIGFAEETEHRVGDFTFRFNEASGADQLINVVNKDGDPETYLELVVKGCGVDKTYRSEDYDEDYTDDSNDTEEAFTVKTTETGTLEVTINVYDNDHDNDTTPDKVFTREVKITGWNVEITPSKVTVGYEDDITFTIVDEEGNPVNNAYIRIKGSETPGPAVLLVDGTKTNINGGTYTYSDDDEDVLDTVGYVELEFIYTKSDGTPDVVVTDTTAIEVVGEEVFAVTSSADTLLNGVEETFTVEVLDADGDVVYPTFTRVNVDSDDDESASTNIEVGSRKDIDGDGVKESVEITVVPNADQAEMIIRATTDSGKKMGETRITVVKPEVVMTGAKSFTDNFDTSLEFQVIDPRDNSVMEDLDLDLEEVSYVGTFGEVDSKALSNDDDVWTGTYKSVLADFDGAETDEKDVVVSIVMTGDSVEGTPVEVTLHDIPVVKASLTATPDSVIIGSGANITLTYKDADGNPLKEREIKLGADKELVGETNENGTLLYAASASNSMSLVFYAETDAEDSGTAVYTDLKVKSAADLNGPTVTYEVVGKTAIITVTDESLISATYVDGQEVKMYFPSKTVTHTVKDLKVGSNVVSVITADVHYNPTMAELDIVVEATAEPISFTLNVATDLGTPVMVEGNTMVPVRFAQDLGATFEYNAETETATYTLGETVISVTVGSTTAVVNGVNTQLPVAPYMNDLDRMMVPVRMIAEDLGFTVNYVSETEPITITQ